MSAEFDWRGQNWSSQATWAHAILKAGSEDIYQVNFDLKVMQ